MDAQKEHDQQMAKRKPISKESKARLEALLLRKNGPSLEPLRADELDPIARAMKNHPGLTREKAEKMAEDYGF